MMFKFPTFKRSADKHRPVPSLKKLQSRGKGQVYRPTLSHLKVLNSMIGPQVISGGEIAQEEYLINMTFYKSMTRCNE